MNNIPFIIAANLLVIGLSVRLGWELCALRIARKTEEFLDITLALDPMYPENPEQFFYQWGFEDCLNVVLGVIPQPWFNWVGGDREEGGET